MRFTGFVEISIGVEDVIYDQLLRQRASEERPIRVGLYGAGFMAKGLVNQIRNAVAGMNVVAICNRDPSKARAVFEAAGAEGVRHVESCGSLNRMIAAGVPAIMDDPFLLAQAELDCIVDATGAVEYGAMITLAAIENGKHLVTMNAELDGTIGPLLKKKADSAGVIFTGCDGDQPGVQMNLFRFVSTLGLKPLVCGNIKGLQDPYRNPTTQESFARQWGQNPAMVTSFADGTKISFEQAIVANATGMSILKRGMSGYDHAEHVDELTSHFNVEQLTDLGGVVDYVVGAKPGPGVFVLATHDDPKQRHYLELYKLGKGPLYSFYTPYHLCHFEVPISIARVVLCNNPVIQPLDGPLVDVVTTAKTNLSEGDIIDGLGGYMTYGQAERYSIARTERLLPIGLAEGCRLRRDLPRDTVLTYDDVVHPTGRLIDRLRSEQDSMFPA
jgi:predicted homoserine dehydrogenase-like protein